MVNNFISWLDQNKNKFCEFGFITFDFYYNEQQMPNEGSVVVTTENKDYICQFTIRNNGLSDIEVLDMQSEELVFYTYCKTKLNVNYKNMFGLFFDFFN